MNTPTPRTDRYTGINHNPNKLCQTSRELETELADITRQRDNMRDALTKALDTIVQMRTAPRPL